MKALRFAIFLIFAAAAPNCAFIAHAADYADYLKEHPTNAASAEIVLDGDFDEWAFIANEAGLYNIEVTFRPDETSSADVERRITIDGGVPYAELEAAALGRVFRQEGVSGTDDMGNDRRPRSHAESGWLTQYVYDGEGYFNEPLAVWLGEGEHTLSLGFLREQAEIGRVTLKAAPRALPYSEPSSGGETSGQAVLIEGEAATRTSSLTLSAVQDPSSPAVSPSSPKVLLNNSIGGEAWNAAGQWIEWEFDAPESGLYEIDMNVKQNFKRGLTAARRIEIDGKTPFDEMNGYAFGYKQNWYVETLGDGAGKPYKFYLTAGRHTLRMTAVLGGYADIITLVRQAAVRANALYGKVIRLTGSTPDAYRDYQVERSLPELAGELAATADILDEAIDLAARLGGKQGERGRVILTLRDQLRVYAQDADAISRNLNDFKTNISACGDWINEAADQPLQIDRILIRSADVKPLATDGGFLASVWFEARRLFYSYIVDYTRVGSSAETGGGERDKKQLTVWLGSGRDQANVIKRLIEEGFTAETGVAVNLQLVDIGTLLQAVMAGQGPDAAFNVGEVTTSLTYGAKYGQMAGDMPVNYGLRGAALDLRVFADFETVRARFADSAMTANEFGGKTFALPETQSFPVMFYRKDIVAELGLELPQTWEDVEKVIAVLSRERMVFGLAPGEQLFATFLFQRGGAYYNADKSASALNSPRAVEAFKSYCEYFTDYLLDKEMGSSGTGSGLSQRFRSGEAPIIIADFGLYNELQVSAPDLRGLWGMAALPGVEEDGIINRSAASGGNSCLILSGTTRADDAWALLKWWTGVTAQTRFGREMESLLGASARVPTANLEAFAALPWPLADFEVISGQRKWARGIEQAPGGYITYRNVNNAFFLATTGAAPAIGSLGTGKRLMNPEEALTDKVTLINDEISYKRKEFGLE